MSPRRGHGRPRRMHVDEEASLIKLSKLVMKARQLGCETFSGTVDVIAAKNWLKRVLDTLIDMELYDKLKLRVAT